MEAPAKAPIPNEMTIQESPTDSVTSAQPLSATSTPVDTPVMQNKPLHLPYHNQMKIYTPEGSTERTPLTPVLSTSGDPTPITSPMTHNNSNSIKKKQRFVKFCFR